MQTNVKPRHEILWLVVAALIPVILYLVFTLLEAQQMVKRQLTLTSSMLMSQAVNISDRARAMTEHLQNYQGRHCDEIKDNLQQTGSLDPYFRSIGVVQNNIVTCSSTFGARQASLESIIRRPLPVEESDRWSLSVPGTINASNRPAVLFLHQGEDGFASYALVDGQYLIDFMWAAGVRLGYDITISFGDGFAIFSGVPASRRSGDEWGYSTLDSHSDRYKIMLSITSPRSELLDDWRQVLLSLLPMALILSLLFIMLTHYWFKRKSSFRDEIRRGIAHDEFSVNYQPIYNLKTQTFGGVEALMRWQRADGHWVRPDSFISAAESEGMIIPLTRHLLKLVVRDSSQWPLEPGFHLNINMAAEHLQHDDFLQDIRDFSAQLAHLQPIITLELTERSLIAEDRAVALKLTELRNEGFKIAIDDFGTGHCALSYLQTFPLDYLKIDRGFVNAIESVDGETPVLDTIIQLANKLELKAVAEGVENAMQLHYLEKHGVSFIQGYYFARPMDAATLPAWLQQHSTAVTPPADAPEHAG